MRPRRDGRIPAGHGLVEWSGRDATTMLKYTGVVLLGVALTALFFARAGTIPNSHHPSWNSLSRDERLHRAAVRQEGADPGDQRVRLARPTQRRPSRRAAGPVAAPTLTPPFARAVERELPRPRPAVGPAGRGVAALRVGPGTSSGGRRASARVAPGPPVFQPSRLSTVPWGAILQMNLAVILRLQFFNSCGGPANNTSPPALPPSGPRSMIQSACRITSR